MTWKNIMIDFGWDPSKAKENLRKHGVSFEEGATIFQDTLGVTIHDPDHSIQEDRYITIGSSSTGRVMMVAHTDRYGRTRIINARELTRKERKEYEDESKRSDD
jgi:uncharacterized DUF497 family protein